MTRFSTTSNNSSLCLCPTTWRLPQMPQMTPPSSFPLQNLSTPSPTPSQTLQATRSFTHLLRMRTRVRTLRTPSPFSLCHLMCRIGPRSTPSHISGCRNRSSSFCSFNNSCTHLGSSFNSFNQILLIKPSRWSFRIINSRSNSSSSNNNNLKSNSNCLLQLLLLLPLLSNSSFNSCRGRQQHLQQPQVT